MNRFEENHKSKPWRGRGEREEERGGGERRGREKEEREERGRERRKRGGREEGELVIMNGVSKQVTFCA